MEEKLNEILDKLNRIENHLFDVNNEVLKNYVSELDREHLIGVNDNLVYEAFLNATNSNVSKREFNSCVKKIFGLRLRHTTKNKQNIYYWSE